MALNDVKSIFRHDGNSIDYTPGANVTGGDIVIFGAGATGMIGVAKTDIAANVKGAVALRGVFNMPTGEALATIGTKVYLTAAGLVTATVGTNTPLGRTVAASTDSNTKVLVAINVP